MSSPRSERRAATSPVAVASLVGDGRDASMAPTSSSSTFNAIRTVAGSIMAVLLQCENGYANAMRKGQDEGKGTRVKGERGGRAREEMTVDSAKNK